MRSLGGTGLKVGVFMAVMLMLTAALFAIFGQYRGGDQNGYTAVFDDVSSLKAGDSVRVAGVRVGTIDSVELQPDNTVLVGFGAGADQIEASSKGESQPVASNDTEEGRHENRRVEVRLIKKQ